MKPTNNVLYAIRKLSKGIFSIIFINLIIITGIFIINSCKRSNYHNSEIGMANKEFCDALSIYKEIIGSISIKNDTINEESKSNSSAEQLLPIYVQLPYYIDINSAFQNISTIQNLSDLVYNTNAIIQYEPTFTSSEYQIQVPISSVLDVLNPLVTESKKYLYARGFTELEIQNMINLNGGTEQDLIPYVMILTDIENNQNLEVANKYPMFGVSNSYAKMSPYVKCALVAIGADVIYSLGFSSASTWTKAALVKAFGAVAKRFLGPIGVALAVTSFGVCIADELL